MSFAPPAPTDLTDSKRPADDARPFDRTGSPVALAIALVATLAVAGCASRSEKKPSLAPQTVSPVASPDPAPPAAAEPAPPPPPPPASTVDKTIVIDPGGEGSRRPSLVAAAEAERERRAQSEGATVVITDENLKSKAIGQLTVASPAPREQQTSAEEAAAPPVDDPAAVETYWRQRMLEARRTWRDLLDEIDDLEEEVALLRRRFYDEDDAYYRDSQIKPAWDRALDRLGEARLLADEAAALVSETLEDGRRSGALPGWLREGIELEPGPGDEREDRSRLREHQSREPQIYDPDGDDGR